MDSRSKCNAVVCVPVFHEVEGTWWEEEFCGCLPVEGFAWSGVEPPCEVVQLLLGEGAEVCAFGQVLAEQTVGVLRDASLPGAVGMGEVDGDAGLRGEGLVWAISVPWS